MQPKWLKSIDRDQNNSSVQDAYTCQIPGHSSQACPSKWPKTLNLSFFTKFFVTLKSDSRPKAYVVSFHKINIFWKFNEFEWNSGNYRPKKCDGQRDRRPDIHGVFIELLVAAKMKWPSFGTGYGGMDGTPFLSEKPKTQYLWHFLQFCLQGNKTCNVGTNAHDCNARQTHQTSRIRQKVIFRKEAVSKSVS